jgi:hypothetical protein
MQKNIQGSREQFDESTFASSASTADYNIQLSIADKAHDLTQERLGFLANFVGVGESTNGVDGFNEHRGDLKICSSSLADPSLLAALWSMNILPTLKGQDSSSWVNAFGQSSYPRRQGSEELPSCGRGAISEQ